jgi:hypothetical protein
MARRRALLAVFYFGVVLVGLHALAYLIEATF